MKKITPIFYVLCFLTKLAYSNNTYQLTNINGFDDTANVVENSEDNKIDVLSNDVFGNAGPLPGGPILVQGPSENGGAVIVDNNGTPNEPLDDRISYYPPKDFVGLDTFTYTIVDANGTADTSVVRVFVMEFVDYQPIARDDFTSVSEDSELEVLVLPNDDFGGNGPSNQPIRVIDQASNGVAVVNDNGTPSNPTDDTIIYTPNENYFGQDTFEYQICDSDGDCDSAIVTIFINDIDDQPIAVNDSTSILEDNETTIEVLVNDDFGGDGPSTRAIEIEEEPSNGEASVDDNGTPSDPTDDTIIYTPNDNYFGEDSFEYQICDSDGDCDTAIVTINITNENDAPVAVDDAVDTLEDNSATIEVLVNDDFGGDGPSTSAITVVEAPSNGEASVDNNGTPSDPTDDTIVYTPNDDYFGADSFEYQICDSDGDCDTAIVTLNITNENDAPVAVDDAVDTIEDNETTIEVLVNDSFGGDGPSTTAITVVEAPSNGEVSVNNNGTPSDPTDDTIIYTPNADYFGEDSFEYQICDVDGDCDTAIVTLNITNENDAPVAVDDAVDTMEDNATTIEVLVNDSFGGDGPSTSAITVVVAPLNGEASVDDNGTPSDPTDDTIVYTPNDNYFGEDSFEYQICDVDGDCDTAIVTLSISNENDAPVAVDDVVDALEDNSVTVEVLVNDSFGGDGPSTTAITVVTTPLNGEVSVNDNGTPSDPTDDTIVYTPNDDYFGEDSFEYQICDVDGDCDTAIVTLNITNENDAPVAVDDAVDAIEDNATTIEVLVNDSFGGDGPSTSAITVVVAPLNGEATVNDNGTPSDPTDDTIVYTPNADYFGEDSFEYQICDVDGDCDTAIVNLSISNENDAPLAVDDTVDALEDNTTTVEVLVNDSFGGEGPSTSAITVVEAPLNGTATVNDNGTPTDPTDDTIVYTPNDDYFGPDSFEYQICDIDGDCDTAIVTLNITNENDLPVAEDDSIALLEDTSVTVEVLVNDDFGGDGPSSTAISVTDQPLNGTATVNDNGTPTDPTDDTIVYTPDADYFGPDIFLYQICDADGDCDSAIVEIEITDVEDRIANINFIKTGTYIDENNDLIISAGDIIVYNFIVENNGDLDIENIIVEDPLPGIELEGGPIDLAVGEIDDFTFSARYVITESDVVAGQVTNQAIARGIDPNGNEVIDVSDDGSSFDSTDLDEDGDGDSEDPTVTILEDPEGVVIFETFSPNGDGVNDEFVIKRLSKYPDNNLQIFNRWGVKVFDKDQYEQPGVERFKGYSDGRVTVGKGEPLPIAAYYYTLNYVDDNGVSRATSGSFYLSR